MKESHQEVKNLLQVNPVINIANLFENITAQDIDILAPTAAVQALTERFGAQNWVTSVTAINNALRIEVIKLHKFQFFVAELRIDQYSSTQEPLPTSGLLLTLIMCKL